jgi:pilus assembly protein FimV
VPAAAAPAAKEEPLEFDLGDLNLHLDEAAPASAPASPAPAAQAASLDMGELDLGGLDLSMPSGKEPSEDLSAHGVLAGGADSGEVDLGDFDLNGLHLDDAAESEGAPSLSDGLDLGDLDGLDLDAVTPEDTAGNDALFAELDETGTKLDLARAYVEMGDADGARSILDEVVLEGNAQQKQQAQELLHQIA